MRGSTARGMKQFVNDITAISLKITRRGHQVLGPYRRLEGQHRELEYTARRFREFGLQDVRMQSFDLPPQWFALDWEVKATGAVRPWHSKPHFPAAVPSRRHPRDLDLEIVGVGAGTELDFAGRDVKGKVAFISSFPTPSANIHTASTNGAMERAAQKGAAAVLLNIYIPGNVTNSAGGAPGIPSFAIGNEDAAQLRGLMEKGPAKVQMKLTTETRPGLKDANVWGTLPGATDEEIVIFAHHDGYFEAAFDNATGVATMMGLAEYFSKIPQAQRKRTLKFVGTAAHHAGLAGHPMDVRQSLDGDGEHRARHQLRAHGDHPAVSSRDGSAPVQRHQRRAVVGAWQRQTRGDHARRL